MDDTTHEVRCRTLFDPNPKARIEDARVHYGVLNIRSALQDHPRPAGASRSPRAEPATPTRVPRTDLTTSIPQDPTACTPTTSPAGPVPHPPPKGRAVLAAPPAHSRPIVDVPPMSNHPDTFGPKVALAAAPEGTRCRSSLERR